MLIAEIRRKLNALTSEDLSPADLKALLAESKEDLLTADVFGALKYLPRRAYLSEVLSTILSKGAHPKSLNRILAHIEGCRFRFWPYYSAPQGIPGGNTEPDLVIENEDMLIFFEMKLHSGLGDQQIERQLALALDHADGREAFVVVVSGGLRMPHFPGCGRDTFVSYLHRRRSEGLLTSSLADRLLANAFRVMWINWRGVQAAMERAHVRVLLEKGEASESVARAGDMLADLRQLFQMRGIQPFHGFAHVLRAFDGLEGAGLFFLAADAATAVAARQGFSLESVVARVPEPIAIHWRHMNVRKTDARARSQLAQTVARWPEPSPHCGLTFGASRV